MKTIDCNLLSSIGASKCDEYLSNHGIEIYDGNYPTLNVVVMKAYDTFDIPGR